MSYFIYNLPDETISALYRVLSVDAGVGDALEHLDWDTEEQQTAFYNFRKWIKEESENDQ
jgi:hypothetical protein